LRHLHLHLQCVLIRFTPSIILFHPPLYLLRTISISFIVQFSYMFTNFINHNSFFLTKKNVKFCQIHFLYLLGNHVIFVFHSINMVYHNDWFLHFEPFFYPQDESLLIVIHDHFSVLLNVIEDFCLYVHQGYWLVVFFPICLCLTSELGWWYKHSW
jgi:hypothetical protein